MSLLDWLAGIVTALSLAVLSGLIREETRARLDRIPYALLVLAIRRLPAELCPDVGEEWHAELEHILHCVEAYPLTRLIYSVRFTIGLLRAAPRIGNDLISTRALTPADEADPERFGAPHRANKAAPSRRTDGPRQIWQRRFAAALAVGLPLTVFEGWQLGLTAAVLTINGMTIYRARRAGPARSSQPTVQTRRHISGRRGSRYIRLHPCTIPGTGEVIDHLVIGPTGIYALVSRRWDRRLPARARSVGARLFHGL